MPVTGKRIFGAKGQDTKLTPFTIDPLRSQIAENFVVKSNSRRSRQQYARWKYDKYCNNAIRFVGTYKKSYVIYKDTDNLRYNVIGNCHGGGGSGQATFEFRIRLHGVGGYSLMSSIPVMSRQIHGTGFTFNITMESTDTPTLEHYNPKLVFSDAVTTTTLNFNTATIRHGEWRTISITVDCNGGVQLARCFIDGVFKQSVATGGAANAAVSTFGTTHNEPTYSDIVIGASNDLTVFSPIDIDEIRIFPDVRGDQFILDNAFREVDQSQFGANFMKAYFNLSEIHDGKALRDSATANPNVLGFVGGNTPYVEDATGKLMFDGSTMFGKFNPIGPAGVTDMRNQWGDTAITIIKVSEIAFTPLKLKQCRIAGNLEMYFDAGNSKYGVRVIWKRNGVNTTLDSGGFIQASDINVTEYHVAIRQIVSTAVLELYVNGVRLNFIGWTTSASIGGFENGKNVGCGPQFNSDFAAIRLKWIRTFDTELSNEYFTDNFNKEVSDFEVIRYSHGVQNEDFTGAATRGFTGVGTALNAVFQIAGPANNQHYFLVKENKEQVGEEYSDILTNLNVGAQTWTGLTADSTGDPWAAGHIKITNKEGYIVTALCNRYNVTSWKNLKIDKTTYITEVPTTSLVSGGFDRDRDPLFKMELYYFAAAAQQQTPQMPNFIGGDVRMLTPKRCLYIQQFKTADGSIDVIITIVGTAFNVFDRKTKVLTQYPISILPNKDKAFTGDFLQGELYITDGVTKIHVYAYKGVLRVVRWGFTAPLSLPTLSAYTGGGGVTANRQYIYCYYNREIDQFGATPFTLPNGQSNQVNLVNNFAAQIDSLSPSPDFYQGVSDIAIFRTKNLNAGPGILGHYYLYDFVKGNSQGAMDWSGNDINLSQRYPVELVGNDQIGPPNGEFVVAHNSRLWIPDFDHIHFSRIGSELHAAVIKSETYLFPSDHFFRIPGSKQITGAASYNDNTLAVFTIDSMDLVIGTDLSDFERRRIYQGVGCVAHRTIKKIGNALIWLGLDDIYVFINGTPQPLDAEGKISFFIRNNVDPANLDKAFAVHNIEDQFYELNVLDTAGNWKTLVFDLRSGEYTINTDIRASAGETIIHDNNRPTVFYGLQESGFVVNQANSGQNYQPISGSLKTTVSSFAGQVITTAANDLQTSEAGLIGNFIYVISPLGGILRAKIIANTNNTITVSATEFEFIMSIVPFVPAAGYTVYIGPIFWHLRTSVLFTGSPQNSLQAAGGETSDPVTQELIRLGFVHIPTNANADLWFSLHREGSSTPESPTKVTKLDQMYSLMPTVAEARAQFMDIECYYLHESVPFDLIGLVLEMNITDSTYAS